MVALDELLAQTAADGAAPSLADLVRELPVDELSTTIRDSAAGPLGHLLCRAAIRTLDGDQGADRAAIDAILRGITRQRSLLTLSDTIDVLLDSGSFVGRFGKGLHDALMQGHAGAIDRQPLLAAGHLEGALRLAIVGAVRPFRVLDALDLSDVTQLDPEYAERLPRLIGAALDRWGDDDSVATPLRHDLDNLRDVPDAAADATFEYGLDLLRRAANEQATTALALLIEARGQMAAAIAAEEDRDDAALYAAGLDAIMAFTRADREMLATSRDTLSDLLNKREAWLRGLHIPAWRRPRQQAERAWTRLLLILDHAAEQLAAPVWLNVWEALAAILEAYELDREVIPVPGAGQAAGLEVMVRPRIEKKTIAQQGQLLANLRHATEAAKGSDHPAINPAQLQTLLDRIDSLTERPADQRHTREPESSSEGDSPALARLIERAPSALARLGAEKGITARTGRCK